MYTDHYHFLHEALVEVKCVSLVEAAESFAALKSLVLANIEQWDHLLCPSNTQTGSPPDFISKWVYHLFTHLRFRQCWQCWCLSSFAATWLVTNL